ncbi:hypothetical protein AA700_1329 [Acidiphilium acidophilum DSM 700]|nr:hypothetical protein AA700_1329 [Acidiphilium acidophilum DSM 700]
MHSTAPTLTGHQIGADLFLPSMATQEFLSCLSKPEIETVAAANGIMPRPTGKATRAAVVDRFKTERFVLSRSKLRSVAGRIDQAGGDTGRPCRGE